MSTRYVWDKYNATEQYTWYDRPAYDLIQTGGGYEVSITINGTTLKNPPWGSADATVTVPAGTFQYDVRGSWGYQPGKVRTTTTTTFRWFYRQYDDYWLIVDQAISIGNPTGYEQGSFIGSVSSSNQSAYPYGYYNGYWYTSKGSDNIDPKSISYPSNIKTGQSITLTTTKSSGIKYGGTIYYTYEVQLSGGSWISIANISALTKSYTVPAGTTTFRARVKANDNMGFASTTYATGALVNVIQNVAPTTPSSISVPSSIQAGKAFTVSWGASTDADGNLAGYKLERKLDSGNFTNIYTGNTLSYQDTIPKANYKTVTYRVCAYDTDNEVSDYKTSNTANVINNTAPTISGSDKDFGSFSYQPPYIEYIVNDADKNEVTVDITLDSATIFSGIVPLGMTQFISFADWSSITKGQHTIKITANDGQGGTTIRTYTFTKNIENTEIVKERWHRNNGHDVYDLIYLETDSNIVITNNGKNLSDRLTAIQSRIAALKG